MSKFMQLKISVIPYYQNSLAATYPNLARRLKTLEPARVEQNPSLYALAGDLDKLLYTFDGTPLREVLLRHREDLKNLHKDIEMNIADWNLPQADRLLYKLEDVFDRIELELS